MKETRREKLSDRLTTRNAKGEYPSLEDIDQAKELEVGCRELWAVLDLISAEFCSDPQSVQFFDLRTVKLAESTVNRFRPVANDHADAASGTGTNGVPPK